MCGAPEWLKQQKCSECFYYPLEIAHWKNIEEKVYPYFIYHQASDKVYMILNGELMALEKIKVEGETNPEVMQFSNGDYTLKAKFTNQADAQKKEISILFKKDKQTIYKNDTMTAWTSF